VAYKVDIIVMTMPVEGSRRQRGFTLIELMVALLLLALMSSILYGSLGVGIALLVWMYMISLVVLVGAEFNAMLFPRARLGIELIESNANLRRH